MRLTIDKILVVDIEATCWAANEPSALSEVIEIGLAVLDVKTLTCTKGGVLVRPTTSTVSPFCTELTGLTPNQVADGIPFHEACTWLRSNGSSSRMWASYGDYDRRMFEEQCRNERVAYPFSQSHLNVKTLLAAVMGWTKAPSMDEALRRLDIPLVGRHHRGVDDAYNIAQLLVRVLQSSRTALHGEPLRPRAV